MMRTVWHSLLWKEWHEHKWRLVSIVAILLGSTALAVFEDERDIFGLAAGVLMMCIVPIAVFIGLGGAANERSRGTLPFLQSLPVPMWRVAVTKLSFGLITLVVPIVLTVAFFYAWHFGPDVAGNLQQAAQRVMARTVSGNWYLDVILSSSLVAASLFIWSAAAGVNRRDEVSAGAAALTVMVGWCGVLLLAGSAIHYWQMNRAHLVPGADLLKILGLSTAPAGFVPAGVLAKHSPTYLFLSLFTAVLTHAALVAWYIRRFGRVANLEVRSPKVAIRDPSRADWLAPPRSSAAAAIAWKQFRQSGPLVLAGLAGMLGIVAVFFVSDPYLYLTQPDQLAKVTAAVIASLGFCVALIVGIGVCFYDVGPRLNTFWRSLPINPDLWFWSKFITGLIVLLAALYLPLFVIFVLLLPEARGLFSHPDAPIVPAIHIAIFAAAVAMTCVVRHAVYAAILSIAFMYVCVGAIWGTWIVAGQLGLVEPSREVWWEPTQTQVAAGFITTFVVGALVAWIATRYDWGRKSRY